VGGRVGLWVPWMHLLAQAGAVTVASAAASLEGAALPGTLMWVALGEALVAGLIGTADRRSELIGLSAGFSAGAFAALAGWLEWGPETVAAAAGAAAVVLAVPATVLWLRRVGGRVGLWVPWMHVLAQAGAVTVLAAGRAATGDAGFAGIVCMVLLAEALPAAGAATVFLDHAWAAGATALVAGASAALARWLEWGPETVAAAAGAAAVVLVVPATVLWLRRVGGRVGLWVPWMHLLAQAGAVVTIAAAAEVVPVEGLLWIAAGVCAADAILVAVVAHTLPELELPLLSAGLALGSAALALAAIGDAPAAFAAHAFVLAAGGAAALAAVARPRGRWTLPLLVAGGGFGGLACGSTLWVFGPAANETATILLIAGAAAIALGLRSGRWWLLQSGTLLWLGPAAILAHRAFDDNPHGYVVGAAVLCLAVLEMERIRREDEGRPFPDEARYAEWALMVAPLLLAAADTVVRSTTFGLLMAAEGAVIFGWALVTQVRRRLVVGAGGTVLAIVLVVAVIAARSTARGLPTGTWLAIGAGVSILLILIGSVLEKNRVRFGRMVGRISQSLEGWR